MTEIYRLAVLDRFQCLAGNCPDTCCAGWDMELDTPTRHRWEQLPEPERKALLQKVTLVPRADSKTSLIAKDVNNRCVHLDAEHLCQIQLAHGHDYLPATCRYFPRLRCELPWRRYDSASLSCPEISRMVLFESIPEQRFNVARTQNAIPAALLPADVQISRALTGLVEAVLSERRFSLNTRIYFLGWTLYEAARLSQAGRLGSNNLKMLCESPRARLYEINLSIKSGKMMVPASKRADFWRWLYELARKRGLNFHPSAVERLERGLSAASSVSGLMPLFEGHEEARLLVRAEGGMALENYLAVTFVNNGFPFAPYEGNYNATFLQAVLPFACVQLQLWLTAADTGTLHKDDIAHTVQHAERRFGHSNALYQLFSEQPGLLNLNFILPLLADMY